MEILIDVKWRPSKKTSSSLIKLGYSQKQLDEIGKIFLQRFGGQSIEKPSTKFYNMVRSSGSAHNLPKPDDTASKALDKKRADDLANRSEDAHERAEASKTVDSEPMTHEQAMAHIDTQRSFQNE